MTLDNATKLERQLFETIKVLEKQPPNEAQAKLTALLSESMEELQRLRVLSAKQTGVIQKAISTLSQTVSFSPIVGRELLRELSQVHQELKLGAS